MSNYLDEISAFICSCRFSDLPQKVIRRGCEVVVDTVAVVAAGSREEEVKALTKRIIDGGGKKKGTIIGTGLRTEPPKAALINGTAGTFLELDEGNQFGRGHPGIHVIPAALALSEEKGFSGRDFLTALILGYEIGTRIGIASKLRMSMHPHGTWGTVGAAVTVGKLMGYDQPTMKRIINVSSSLGLATSRQTMLQGGTVRNVYAGVSGFMGFLAHELVQSGFTGEIDGLGTIFGTVVSDSFDPSAMTEDLGTRYEIARNYFKRHACCRYNHGSLDALEQIMAKRPGGKCSPDEVIKVEVETYSLAAQLCDQDPQNVLAGKFSIPFALATTIFHGNSGVESFRSEAITNPTVRELARRIKVSEDPKLTAMMPNHRPSRVTVTFKDGSVSEAQVMTNKGDTEDPYPREVLREKFFELAKGIWQDGIAQEIYEDTMKLESLDNLNRLTEKLRKIA